MATELKVKDVMTVNPLTAAPDSTVRAAIALMRERGIPIRRPRWHASGPA